MKVSHKIKRALIGIGGGTLTVCICAGIWIWSGAAKHEPVTNDKPIHTISFSYAVDPLSTYLNAPDPVAIVKGTLTRRYHDQAFLDTMGFAYTPLVIRIDELLYGNVAEKALVCTEKGGKIDGVIYQVGDEDNLDIGQQAIVVLIYSTENGFSGWHVLFYADKTGEDTYSFPSYIQDMPKDVSIEQLKAIIAEGAPQDTE